MVLQEFTSGSTARRVLVGAGPGHCTVACQLGLQDASAEELPSKKIRVRDGLALNSYRGNNALRRRPTSSLDRRFLVQIEKVK
jgi:hypothetical protein